MEEGRMETIFCLFKVFSVRENNSMCQNLVLWLSDDKYQSFISQESPNVKDILNWWTFTPTRHFKEMVYMLMNKTPRDTFSSHKRFLLTLGNENLLFHKDREEECVFSQRSRGLKSHLLPVSGHLYPGSILSCAEYHLHPPKGSWWERKPWFPVKSLAVSLLLVPMPLTEDGHMVSKYNIYLPNAVCAKNSQRLLWVNIYLRTS